MSGNELRKYHNIDNACPPDSCTLFMALTGGVYGLAAETHDGNLYGMLVEGSTSMCPRHIVNGRSNFTVLELPTCPVIVESAMLPKDKETKPKPAKSSIWIIPVCVGLVILAVVIVIVVIYFCIRSKKKPVQPANSIDNDQRLPKSAKPTVSYHNSTSKRFKVDGDVTPSPRSQIRSP
uniref:LCCL domain-containing protein n=1 Tax=Panagrellus redivivus TaxID=6233 RepID=A0A7E4ZXW4_PANRE